MPFDIASTRRSRASREADQLEQPSALGRAAGRAGQALVQLEQLVGRHQPGKRNSSAR